MCASTYIYIYIYIYISLYIIQPTRIKSWIILTSIGGILMCIGKHNFKHDYSTRTNKSVCVHILGRCSRQNSMSHRLCEANAGGKHHVIGKSFEFAPRKPRGFPKKFHCCFNAHCHDLNISRALWKGLHASSWEGTS